MVMSDRELLELHIQVLFTHDSVGRLDRVNEPNGPPAPWFYVGQSYEGRIMQFRRDLPSQVVATLERLAGSEPVAADLRCSQEFRERCRQVLGEESALEAEYSGPAYRFPDEIDFP